MAAVIKLCGWAELQHYKNRSPPWVKLYRELLTSESWVLGTDTSRLVQVASMLLAARYNNEIPYRWDLLKKVASLECTESAFRAALLHLVSYNFLEIQEVTSDENSSVQAASTLLAGCYARVEESRGEKRRGETEEMGGARSTRAATAQRLPADFELSESRRGVATKEGADADREFAKFTDHWRAASGANARKHDWDAAWRNWCRKSQDMQPRANGARRVYRDAPTTAELEAREAARAGK